MYIKEWVYKIKNGAIKTSASISYNTQSCAWWVFVDGKKLPDRWAYGKHARSVARGAGKAAHDAKVGAYLGTCLDLIE